MASDTAQAQEDLDLRTLDKVKDGEVNEMYIFTPLRVGWPPTPQVNFGSSQGVRGLLVTETEVKK